MAANNSEKRKAILNFIFLLKMCLYMGGQLCDIKSKQMEIDLILKLAPTLDNGLVTNVCQVQFCYFPSIIPEDFIL